MSPEQTFLKLYIRAQRPKQLSSNEIGLLNMSGMSSRVKIHLDLICNEFEYEILYKRAFSNSPVLLEMHNLQSEQLINENFMQQANKHKRVYSQGNYASTGIGGSNASPASHLNLYGSPNQLKNQAVLQQEIQNPALLSQMAMNNTSPQLGLGPQNISMLYQQQQEELQKLFILKQQAVLLQIQQQQQIIQNQLAMQTRGAPGMNQNSLPPNLMPPPGLGVPQGMIAQKMP